MDAQPYIYSYIHLVYLSTYLKGFYHRVLIYSNLIVISRAQLFDHVTLDSAPESERVDSNS